MKLTKFTVQACCGRTTVIYKVDQCLTKEVITSLVSLGFIEEKHFSKTGIIYVHNSEYIMTAPIGSDRLQVKCKLKDCEGNLANLEALLQQIG